MASSGSPKLFLALLVTSFINSLHTHTERMCTYARAHIHTNAHLMFDHVSPRKNEHTMGMFGAHRRVGRSCWICTICRFRSDTTHRSSECAQQTRWLFNKNRLHQKQLYFVDNKTCHFEATGMVGQVHRSTGELATSRPQGWSDKYIVQQGNLPLRGHRDGRTSTSSNRGNFWAVLEMMAKRDDTL